ncbi:hypothetical protein NQ314_008015 [Rhamnusium bicolor]|uniref:Uncharacterized protein n=1 Tax=Rhamnusium bicolor TaxID=1586634 RepID=A0AAV8YFY6_9CUCU|nr:hypothetical protein NQ314_008015 [Rhamnusium bicolor]
MSEAMEKAGQSSKPIHLIGVSSYSQRNDKENMQRSIQRERLSRSLDLDEDDDDNFGKSIYSLKKIVFCFFYTSCRFMYITFI